MFLEPDVRGATLMLHCLELLINIKAEFHSNQHQHPFSIGVHVYSTAAEEKHHGSLINETLIKSARENVQVDFWSPGEEGIYINQIVGCLGYH